MILGSLFTFIAIIIYLAAAIMSFFPSMFKTACVSLRCPEHLWLQKSYWRSSGNESDSTDLHEDMYDLDTGFVERKIKQAVRTTTFRLPSTTTKRLISHRRLRPHFATRPFATRKRPYIAGKEQEENQTKEKLLCQRRRIFGKKLQEGGSSEESNKDISDESGESRQKQESDDDAEYCPEERDGDDGSGTRTLSKIVSVLYVLLFLAFQIYCLYGFLCFANELKKELG
ncbi:uncharacterized protein [Halyomorpha halys]|uniref:uncharacterized protein n=1 Tax=Halyomorpha halys TaxID=286706 RepID=UPI0034D1BB4E